ncbi:major facilitator superfamily domain-containing protein [Radiomyces spectabilis]|uniref:major facilitator superfamily domain-containing protein n=1 Tax=Radiomyces spectabilis TaxID=64574 RepID=UPI002220BDED|nr:major facilitator superfamily domain-containing protein [Radiomyces spectabilis]KAI8366634.1 major facilitator superfamily domain-containing protein [Radiomyces spectabilis]
MVTSFSAIWSQGSRNHNEFAKKRVTEACIYDPAAERAVVKRLDKRLLLFAMFGNMVKTLDNTNLASAFISGMEEELQVTGLEYNWMGVAFMIGYLLMQIPSNLLLSRVRPSVYLPCLEMLWCVLTLAMACAQSVRSVLCIRLLLGLAEAGFYPGIIFLIGTWYTKRELGKRLALLNICGSLGSGLSGVIQAFMLKTMDGVWNISGWRWMFFFDATITFILALVGYHVLPDYPNNTAWLSKSEQAIATGRTEKDGKEFKRNGQFLAPLKKLYSNHYLYLFMVGWASLHIALGACTVLGIVSKKLGYGAVTANLLGGPDTLITMIAGVCNGFSSDYFQTRIWCILIPATVGLIGCCMLSVFVQPFGLLYFGFILTHAGLGCVSSIIMTYATETISKNADIRAMAIAIMNTSSSSMWLWTPLVLWPVTDAPYYRMFAMLILDDT